MSSTIDPNMIQGLGLSLQKDETKTDKLGQEDFLRLMLTQLEHQDPLKPMENGDFLGQMAQFGTVSGINELQSAFQQLSDALYSNQALQASAMVGRSVLVPGAGAVYEPGHPVRGQVELDGASSAVAVVITDTSGQTVRRIELGTRSAGANDFSWDGLTDSGKPALPGTYGVRAEAVVDGQTQGVDTLVSAVVDSVTLGRNGDGMTLNLRGIGPVEFNQVRQVG